MSRGVMNESDAVAASEAAAEAEPETPIAKRILLGDPLATTNADEHLLPKRMALPIFASDALSSVAYGP